MTGIILAGGQSKRIGVNKAFLKINGSPVIELIIARLRPLFHEIMIVTKQPRDYLHLDARVVGDLLEDKGSIIGLHTGLSISESFHNFVIACDMPLLKPRLIEYMGSLTRGHDVVVPRPRGRYEPLFAFYSRRCIQPVESLLRKGSRRIIDFYPEVRLRAVAGKEISEFDHDGLSFININSMMDYQRVKGLS